MSISGGMDKLNVVYSYNGIVFDSKKDEILIYATP